MPEDEGVDGLPLEEQRTLYMRNVHLARYSVITIPLAEALLDGPMRAAEVPIEDDADALDPRPRPRPQRGRAESTAYDSWMETLGIEPFMALQEAIADVYGFLLTISEPWLAITGISRLEMCATHMAELLHYLRRGPQYYGDPGAAYRRTQLPRRERLRRDRRRRQDQLERGGLLPRHGRPGERPDRIDGRRPGRARLRSVPRPLRLADRDRGEAHLDAMREELTNVPTSIAFYSASDVAGRTPERLRSPA